MSESITVATVGAPATKVVVDAPAPTAAAVDATGAGAALKPAEPAASGADAALDQKDPNLGRAFAALARKDSALRERETAVKAQAAELKKLQDAITTARDKKDPTALLEAAGITPSELTDILIKLGQEPGEADRIAALEKKVADDAKSRQDETDKAAEAQLQDSQRRYRARLADEAKAAGDKFELTLAHGEDGIDLAWSCVEAQYEKDGKVLPFQEALAMAEGHYDNEAKLTASTKKYGALKPLSSTSEPGARADHAPDTLTNQHVSGAPPAEKRAPMTREQSIAEAARLMEARGWGKR